MAGYTRSYTAVYFGISAFVYYRQIMPDKCKIKNCFR